MAQKLKMISHISEGLFKKENVYATETIGGPQNPEYFVSIPSEKKLANPFFGEWAKFSSVR